MTSDDVLENLLEECHEDHVGLWRIINAVRWDLGSENSADIQALTLRLVRRLLEERGMQVGHPTADGRDFVSWDLDPDQALNRIRNEWAALGRDPNIGEVAWFTLIQQSPDKPL